MDNAHLTCSLAISAQGDAWKLNLALAETAGRYLTIRHTTQDGDV
ncbi:hypothetical protein [Yersinia pestis]|nr:hypothetical protein [Yersinia pestis]EDR51636.1 hypothetical protein YpB42003004_2160 [Yersinia pestis biovar Antiqua str. B42003004]QOW13170.1 hypothetical protein S96127_0863 [Yersinia pestis]